MESITSTVLNFHTIFSDTWRILLTLSVVFLIAKVLVIVSKYTLRRRKYQKLLPVLESSFIHPLGYLSPVRSFKNLKGSNAAHEYIVKEIGKNFELYKKEKLFCAWAFYTPFVVLTKAEAVEDLLKRSNITEKGFIQEWIEPLFGTGLSTSDGIKWRHRRKLLTPCFHSHILQRFMTSFNDKARVFVKCLHKEKDKDFIDINKLAILCILDIICETMFGVKLAVQENTELQYPKSVKRIGEITMSRFWHWSYWLNSTFIFTKVGQECKNHLELMLAFTRSIIREKKENFHLPEEGDGKRKALMDRLLQHHLQVQDFSEEDIREEVDTFAAAGHETTAGAISWALYLIGLHKDVQANIHQELDRIFGDDIERPVTVNDLKEMTYLDCVLKETKRLYPPVPLFTRYTNEEINLCGYTIPKETMLLIVPYHLHRDEEEFPDPEKFDPDRFLPENSVNRHPSAYIPFSTGQRMCIGHKFSDMEEKVIVAIILMNFTVKSLDERDKLIPRFEITLKSSIPIRLRMKPRFSKLFESSDISQKDE